MSSPLTLFFKAVFFLETLAAVLQNGIMAVVLGWEWVRGKVLPAGDTIIMCLAASRFSLHGMTFTNNLLVFFNFGYVVSYLDLLWNFSNTLTFWLTALLSVFYCVRIASFSHPTFLWLRWRISHSVPRLLLGCMAISILASVPLATKNIVATHVEASMSPLMNGSWAERLNIFYRNFYLFHGLLALSPPFLLFLVSTALLMLSLCRHLHQIWGGSFGSSDPSTQVHIMALKSLGLFFVFYTFYFLSVLVALMNPVPQQCLWFWVWQVVMYIGMSLHSTILLFSSPRLRRALEDRLWCCGATGRRGLGRGQVPPKGSDQEPVCD